MKKCKRTCWGEGCVQPRSQGLRGETVTKTLVKFVLSFQNFGEKIACAVRLNRIQLYCNLIAIRLCRTAHAIFFPKFWNDKMNFTRVFVNVSPRRPWDRGWDVSARKFKILVFITELCFFIPTRFLLM